MKAAVWHGQQRIVFEGAGPIPRLSLGGYSCSPS